MPGSGKFEGSFQFLPSDKATQLQVTSTFGFSLGIRDSTSLSNTLVNLDLYPFDIGILTRPFNSTQMKEGFFYSVQGTEVGSYMERDPHLGVKANVN